MTSRPVSGDALPLIVRYPPEARAQYEAKLTPLVRRQAILAITLGIILMFLAVVLPAVALLSDGETSPVRLVVGLIVLAVLPTALIIAGARRLRARPTLPEVALTVTSDTVTFAARERTTMLTRRRPEQQWDRRATDAEFIEASPGTTERITFTTRLDGKTRTEYQALDYVDTPAEVILAAVRAP